MTKKDIDFSSLEVDGIDHSDHPDYCDAYFINGNFTDGTPLNESDLEILSSDWDLLNEKIMETIY
jgi:hypothetical protein